MAKPNEQSLVPISGVPALWLLEITGADGDTVAVQSPNSVTKTGFMFNNIAEQPELKAMISSDTGTYKEIAFADESKMRFAYADVVYEGDLELVEGVPQLKTNPDAYASGKGELLVSINGGALGYEGAETTKFAEGGWAATLTALAAKKNSYFLAIIGTALTANSLTAAKIDGYAYVVVKLASDISNKTPLALTFKAQKYPGVDGVKTWATGFKDALTAISYATNGTIKLKRNNAIVMTPVALVEADCTTLAAGDVVYKKVTM